MTIGTRLFTWLHGAYVGADSQGNRYYRERKTATGRREKRWVLYSGEAEASRVPPDWHGWLHHVTDTPPPPEGLPTRKPWQRPHQANLSGTARAYHPPGSTLAEGHRPHATGDYEAWKPE
ncbi:MAG: NADH:ubiquinone oxidoreductase subunit NDUFA12 [Alphaproteobacteria bacterium]|nr:NADH:ubiquinone oxidoreductase subunit NDUFA12 [Alphaproteobacteria bacterium]